MVSTPTLRNLKIHAPRLLSFSFLSCGLILVINNAVAQAGINSSTAFQVDLQNEKEAQAKVTWSMPQYIKVTQNGLGWEGGPNDGTRDFWLQTEPIAIGQSWRAPTSASIRVDIDHAGTQGRLFVRYSCDRQHWTTWQPLTPALPELIGGLNSAHDGESKFHGKLQVPRRAMTSYDKLRLDYSRRKDVAWRSDEQALVTELVKQDPAYFQKTTPFIGYVQLLYETELPAGTPIRNVDVNIGWALSGRHHELGDKETYNNRANKPWQFEAKAE